jgi:hypothetical protein
MNYQGLGILQYITPLSSIRYFILIYRDSIYIRSDLSG